MFTPPEVVTEKVLAPRSVSDGSPKEIPLFVAKPKENGSGPRPALLLLQEAFGVNHHIQDVCERYARLGYVVVSPDFYYRAGHWKAYDYNNFQETVQLREELTEPKLLGDLSAALDYIAQLDGVDSSRIGVLGYCMGGRLSFVTACHFSDRIRGAAIYYGGGLTAASPQFPIPPVEQAERIQVPVVGFFGGQDKGIPKEAVEEIEQALAKANVEHRIYFYPEAGHGFFCNERPAYDPSAAQDAWLRTVSFFGRQLGPVDPAV